MTIKSLDTFIDIAKGKPRKHIAVASAEDEPVLKAIKEAMSIDLIEPILVGNQTLINEIAKNINFNLTGIEIINEPNPFEASKKCVKLIRDGEAEILMKGLVSTADYLRAVLDKEIGLRKGDLLSHIGFFELKNYHKLLAITDAAQNIRPTLEEKISIIKNSVDIFHRIGISNPKIALVAAAETVSTKMESTVHAAIISMMNKRKQIKGCLIDGPLGFDNAISKEAAEHKGIISDVAGDADLLVTSEIDAANILYKSLTYFAEANVAAVILGAAVPIVLTSRSDSDKSKLMSIALAATY